MNEAQREAARTMLVSWQLLWDSFPKGEVPAEMRRLDQELTDWLVEQGVE